jgi:hypothetical protein
LGISLSHDIFHTLHGTHLRSLLDFSTRLARLSTYGHLLNWCDSCIDRFMSKAVIVPEELLERATALAKSERNIEIMDRTAILHGYLELTRLDPNNTTYRKNVEDAAASLLQAAHDVIGQFA